MTTTLGRSAASLNADTLAMRAALHRKIIRVNLLIIFPINWIPLFGNNYRNGECR